MLRDSRDVILLLHNLRNNLGVGDFGQGLLLSRYLLLSFYWDEFVSFHFVRLSGWCELVSSLLLEKFNAVLAHFINQIIVIGNC